MITCTAFSITSMDAYSYGPWKLPQPVKMFGIGNPINDNCEPSVPPRIGSVFAGISNLAINVEEIYE